VANQELQQEEKQFYTICCSIFHFCACSHFNRVLGQPNNNNNNNNNNDNNNNNNGLISVHPWYGSLPDIKVK